MIVSNLAVLLAERKLKITKVSKDTGISRTTLTALSSNNSQGVQFDTLNTLCKYLNVNPEQIILFTPFDFAVKEIRFEGGFNKRGSFTFSNSVCVELYVNEHLKQELYTLEGKISGDTDGDSHLASFDVYFYLSKSFLIERPDVSFSTLFTQLPQSIISFLDDQLLNSIAYQFAEVAKYDVLGNGRVFWKHY